MQPCMPINPRPPFPLVEGGAKVSQSYLIHLCINTPENEYGKSNKHCDNLTVAVVKHPWVAKKISINIEDVIHIQAYRGLLSANRRSVK
jgi:hypothetical protein